MKAKTIHYGGNYAIADTGDYDGYVLCKLPDYCTIICTEDEAKVTCKNCLKSLNKKPPIVHFDDIKGTEEIDSIIHTICGFTYNVWSDKSTSTTLPSRTTCKKCLKKLPTPEAGNSRPK